MRCCGPALLTWLSCALLAAPALALPVLSVDLDPASPGVQSERTVTLGSLVDIQLWISDVEASSPLHAFELDLGFDPAIVGALSVADAGFLGVPIFLVESDIAAPDVRFAETRLGTDGVFGSGALVSIQLQAVALGSTDLELLNVILSAPNGVPLGAFELAGGRLVVVPEPGSAALLALLALAGSIRVRVRAG